MASWKQKIFPLAAGALAPDWYRELKAQGASQEKLRAAVQSFCLETLPAEEMTDELVDLMIASYEA